MAVETFTATTTWTCPAGVFEVDVECWGNSGGGAGGGVDIGGGGGGGGAYARKATYAVTPGVGYDVTVSVPSDINPTYFDNPTTGVAADFGITATVEFGAFGGQAANSVGDTKFSGGTGGDSSVTNHGGGGGGSCADSAGAGNNGANGGAILGGAGGAAVGAGGAGGAGGDDSLVGNPGGVPGGGGGGGGGGAVPQVGATGQGGQVRLTYSSSSSRPASIGGAPSASCC